MPALNFTQLASTSTTYILQVATSTALSTIKELPDISTATLLNIATSSATAISTPNTSANANSSWTLPVIMGVVLATFAILVGLPSAILAIRKLRKRP